MALATLTALAEPASPPTAAMQSTLATNMAALAPLGTADLKAFITVCLTYSVNTAGDTDYRAAHATLISDGLKMFNGISLIDDGANPGNTLLVQTVLAWAGAYDGDNTIGTSVATILDKAKDLRQLPESDLDRINLFLQWMLTV